MKMRLLLGVLALGLFLAIGVVAVSIAKSTAHAAELERWGADPNHPPDLDDFTFVKSQLSVPDDLTDEEINEMVQQLFVAEDWRWNHLKLSMVGRRAVPMLVNLLDDPRIAEVEFPLRLRHSGITPLHRVTLLLEPFGPPEAAPAYAKLAYDEKAWVRSRAGEALANIGTAECIKPVYAVLTDEEIMLRLMTVRGIATGMDLRRATPEFLEGVFSTVVEIPGSIESPESGTELELAAEATLLALRIDPEKAGERIGAFLQESSSEPFVLHFLQTVEDQQIPLLSRILASWVNEVEARYSPDDSSADIFQILLLISARNPDRNTEAYLRDVMKSGDRFQRLYAIQALEVLKGVDTSYSVRESFRFDEGKKQLSDVQRCVVEVSNMIDAMFNGYSSVYTNRDAAELARFEQALKQLQVEPVRERFMKAGKILGRVDTENNFVDESQGIAVGDLPEGEQKRLTELNEAAFEDSMMLDQAIRLYIIDHKSEFPDAFLKVQ